MMRSGLVLLLLSFAPSVVSSQEQPTGARLRAVLEQVRAGEQSEAALLRRVSNWGDAGTRAIVALLSGKGEAEEVPIVLNADEQAFLRSALGSASSKVAVKAIEDTIGRKASLGERMRAIELIGIAGNADSIRPLFAIASKLDEVERRHPLVERQLVGALRSILERDPAAYRSISSSLRKLEVDLLPSVARALGEAGSGRAVPLLDNLLGRSPELTLISLEAFGQLKRWSVECASGNCAVSVSGYLGSPDPKTRRQAVLALGALRDVGSFSEILMMLEDPDPRVRRSSLRALQGLTGKSWAEDQERWQDWYAQEELWFEVEFPELLSQLDGPSIGRSAEALRQMSFHPLFAYEISKAIAPFLHHSEETVALAACHTLVRLEDPSVPEILIDVLEDDRTDVKTAAWSGLRRLTGEQLPAEGDAWRALLEG